MNLRIDTKRYRVAYEGGSYDFELSVIDAPSREKVPVERSRGAQEAREE